MKAVFLKVVSCLGTFFVTDEGRETETFYKVLYKGNNLVKYCELKMTIA